MNRPDLNTIKKINLYPDFLVKEINSKLNYYIGKYKNIPRILREAIDYCVKNGGKRFRPVLCTATADSLGSDYHSVMPTACAIEFIHTYSLIHDDLPAIDNDDLRRGKPTCHKKFGEDIAILAGDALFAESFNIILDYQAAPADSLVRVLKEITGASGASGMVAGQIIDVYYTGTRISKNKLENMHFNKTAKLIIASVRSAAIICGADGDLLEGLTKYASNIGLAFQITDDIIDITSSSSITGKTSGKDIKQKKNTYPFFWGINKSKKIARDKTFEAIEIIHKMDLKGKLLEDLAKFILVREV